jgi:hypothetical protein
MSKGTALTGLTVLLSAIGCGNSNSAAPDGGTNATGRAGAGNPTTGNRGAGGSGGASASNGAPTPTGVAGAGPTSAGAAGAIGTSPGAAGATGTSAGAAGATGTGTAGQTGATGAAGAGAAGTSGGSACGDPLTHCAGTMSGAWCVDAAPNGGQSFMGMWANRPDDVWLVGGDFSTGIVPNSTGMYAHFDGCAWTVTPRPDLPQLLGVWGAAPNDVWIVGSGSNAYRWDGSALTPFPIPGATIVRSVHGTSSADVWAVGVGGLFHWNGSAWAQSSTASGNDVWAVAPNDVWVASGSTDALHFDGTTWTATALTDFGLFTSWGDGTQAYAGGEGEALFHFTGGSWIKLQGRGGSSEGFTDIGGLGADIFAVGNNQIFRLTGDTFTPIPDGPPATGFRMVWVSPTQVWLAAGSGSVAHRSR